MSNSDYGIGNATSAIVVGICVKNLPVWTDHQRARDNCHES